MIGAELARKVNVANVDQITTAINILSKGSESERQAFINNGGSMMLEVAKIMHPEIDMSPLEKPARGTTSEEDAAQVLIDETNGLLKSFCAQNGVLYHLTGFYKEFLNPDDEQYIERAQEVEVPPSFRTCKETRIPDTTAETEIDGAVAAIEIDVVPSPGGLTDQERLILGFIDIMFDHITTVKSDYRQAALLGWFGMCMNDVDARDPYMEPMTTRVLPVMMGFVSGFYSNEEYMVSRYNEVATKFSFATVGGARSVHHESQETARSVKRSAREILEELLAALSP